MPSTVFAARFAACRTGAGNSSRRVIQIRGGSTRLQRFRKRTSGGSDSWLALQLLGNWDLPGITKTLQNNFRVIRLDLPGHGGSDKPQDQAAYGPSLVSHLLRLPDHLKISKAHLVGYSMGGIVAARFAVDHPDRVLSLTLSGMGWLREGSIEQKLFAAGGRDGKPAGICFRSLSQLALTEQQVRDLRIPAAVFFGDDDTLRILYRDPLKRIRPDWHYRDITNANHLSCILRPEFCQCILEWHRQQHPPGRSDVS